MKACVQEVHYTVIEPKNYLVLTIQKDAELLSFPVDMATRNRILGLLSLQQQMSNGQLSLYYDLMGYYRLEQLMSESNFRGSDLLRLMKALCDVLSQLSEYYIRPSHCILEAQHIYCKDVLTPALVLVPQQTDAEDSSMDIRALFSSIMGLCPFLSGDPAYSKIASYLFKPEFRLQEFAKLCEVKTESKYIPSHREEPILNAQKEQEKIDIPVQEVVVSKPPISTTLQSEKPKEPTAVSMNGLLIPGAPVVADEKKKKKEKPQKEPKEPKQLRIFGISFGKKEGKVQEQNKAQPPISVPVSRAQTVPDPIPQQETPQISSHQPIHSQPQRGEVWTGTVLLGNEDSGATVLLDDSNGVPSVILRVRNQSIEVNQSPFTLGRENCHCIVSNPKVSRRHATLLYLDNQWYVQDENSANHTFLNGNRLPPYTPVLLTNGGTISLGPEMIHVELR